MGGRLAYDFALIFFFNHFHCPPRPPHFNQLNYNWEYVHPSDCVRDMERLYIRMVIFLYFSVMTHLEFCLAVC